METPAASPWIMSIIGALLFALILFFLLRSILLWYWKVNTIVKNQETQIKLMKEQNDLLEKISSLRTGGDESQDEI